MQFLKFVYEYFSRYYYLCFFFTLQSRWASVTIILFRVFLDLIQRRVPPENDFSPKHRSVAGLCIGSASFYQVEGRRVENRGNFRATKLSEVSANCICIYQADLLKKSIARKRNLHIIMRTRGFTWDNKYDNGVSENFTRHIILRTLFKIRIGSKHRFLTRYWLNFPTRAIWWTILQRLRFLIVQ